MPVISDARKPRVLFYDLENAPNLGWTWGKYEQNVIDFKASWYLLSFAYKWDGQKRVTTHALPDYPNFKKDKADDSALAKELWKLFDEADVLVAHNGDKFDAKKRRRALSVTALTPQARASRSIRSRSPAPSSPSRQTN